MTSAKIAIHQEILSNNEYRLTAEDREEIERHSETGYVILNSPPNILVSAKMFFSITNITTEKDTPVVLRVMKLV